MTNTITILTSRSVATKTWLPDGTILGFDAGYGYNVESVPVAELQALSNLLTIIQHKPQLMAIRGQYRGDDHARTVMKLTKRTGQIEPGLTSDGLARRILENFDDAPLPWMMIDIDDYAPPLGIDPVLEPERAIQAYIGANLPPCFYGTGYHWQLSSSAGHARNAGLLKAHVWFWLSTPMTSGQLYAWRRFHDPEGNKIDGSVFNAVQPHYTALPVFAPGVADPVPRRCGLSAGGPVALTIDPATAAAASRANDGRYDVTDPREKPGVIGAFCRTHTIEQLLGGLLSGHFEFERGSEWRLTWLRGGGSEGGAFITEDRLHVVSKHATDPCRNRKTNLFDLVRIHCFGAADAGADWMALKQMRTTPSQQAMLDYAMRCDPVVEAVRAENAARMVVPVPAVADAVPGLAGVVAPLGQSPMYVPPLPQGMIDARDGTSTSRPLTEHGNALRLQDRHGNNLRYVIETKSWIYWSDGAWHWDTEGAVPRQIASNLAPAVYSEGAGNLHEADAYAKWARKSQENKTIRAAVSILSDIDVLRLSVGMLDRDIMQAGIDGGRMLLDLRTGAVRLAVPSDYVTKSLNVREVGSARDCPRWLHFLEQVFNCDRELIDWIQRWCGYVLTGDVSEQFFCFAFGTGRNGKGTFAELLKFVMGDYARIVAPETLSEAKRAAGGASPDVAALAGARLVLSAETNDGSHMAEGLIKTLTGGDTITARQLYGLMFEFMPQFKMLISGNHKPVIKGVDYAIWARVRMIPFLRTFADHERDPKLQEKLRAEAPHILAWMIEGCLQWQRRGLQDVPAVIKTRRRATRQRWTSLVLGSRTTSAPMIRAERPLHHCSMQITETGRSTTGTSHQ
jgi:P4 family phage/plasmid primase-like protien